MCHPYPRPFLVRNRYLSLDPFIRGRMDDKKSYAQPMIIGGVMAGYAVGEIIASKNASFKKGDLAIGNFSWQQFAISDGQGVRRITDPVLPVSLYLGVLGMPRRWCCRWRAKMRLCNPSFRVGCMHRLSSRRWMNYHDGFGKDRLNIMNRLLTGLKTHRRRLSIFYPGNALGKY